MFEFVKDHLKRFPVHLDNTTTLKSAAVRLLDDIDELAAPFEAVLAQEEVKPHFTFIENYGSLCRLFIGTGNHGAIGNMFLLVLSILFK